MVKLRQAWPWLADESKINKLYNKDAQGHTLVQYESLIDIETFRSLNRQTHFLTTDSVYNKSVMLVCSRSLSLAFLRRHFADVNAA